MKKLFLMGVIAAMLTSCSIHRATVISTEQPVSTKTTTTVASLNVSQKRVTYTYNPTKSDAKRLSAAQLMENAMYMALKQNGNADVLVKVNSYVTTKVGLSGRRIKSISVSGYPAYYTDFREPNEADYKNLYIFGATNLQEVTVEDDNATKILKTCPAAKQQGDRKKKGGLFGRLLGK